jgi:hypothetical protein
MRKLIEDDSGVNVLLEYIINFGVLLVLLTLVWLTYQTIITESNNTIAHEEYRVFANDIANRIVLFDSMAKSTVEMGGSNSFSQLDSKLELTFDTPPELADMAYTIDITGDITGNSVKVSSADRYSVTPITATFKTTYPVKTTRISGSVAVHTIKFNSALSEIEVT